MTCASNGDSARSCWRTAHGATVRSRSKAPTSTSIAAWFIRTASSTGSTTIPRKPTTDRASTCRPALSVIGGGLASIDVVKVLQIENTLKALRARGIEEDMLRLEREGIEPVLQAHGLKYADLGVAPCRLFYRRRVLDMPLSDIAPDAPPKRAEAMRAARAKILDKAQRKFLFEFEPLRVPTGLIVEDGRLAGLQMSRTEVADGQVRTVA